ncbi:DUF4412 domain-containing protein [Kordia sp.]|uniref:DUF4412 domain-containing protein n=1 Tax=Kordia sp. TaxID=1965332 RepID=UPI003B5AB8E2
MKKIALLVALAFSTMIFAQEKLKEGKITMKQTMSTDNEQVQAQFDIMGQMESVTFFKDKSSRSEMSNSMTGDIVTIIDVEKNAMLMLMDSPELGKMYVLEKNFIKKEDQDQIKLEKLDKTKMVLGYECTLYKATIDKNGSKVEMEMYTTEAIDIPSQQTSAFGDKIKGFPLYMVIKMNQMGAEVSVVSEVTKIDKEEVSSDLFSLNPPEGYKNMKE